ncbi:MAG: 6-phosphofructokinase [Christensenellales bacterium]|jgi:6-phosphofructokinase 1
MKKLAILTSGGDSPGMNACIRAAVRYAIYNGYKVYGAARGYVGLLQNDIFEMHTRSVSDIIHRGGTILKTARCEEFKERANVELAAANLKCRGISGLIVIGGDGSFKGARDLRDFCGVDVVGIPGTIDNDLPYTDFTLGFDTAVNTVLWAINNVRDTMTSHDRVLMLEVMGRKCGDIALYAGLAGGAEYVITPEKGIDIEEMADNIKASAQRGKTSNLIIIAEGAAELKDKIKEAIEAKVNKNVHYTKLGYIQRGGTPTLFDRTLAARFAVQAVDLIRRGETGRLVGIKGNQIIDREITDALNEERKFDERLYEIARILAL